ncbi:hypothetical protein BJV82DRAFT_231697 [Fennellomyces sp. T-0311]|nr:hypothetical protein BJV82DRAFT_231697 [Fennellomyces sp. T-0311]
MKRCRYCGGSYTKRKLKRHETSCFEKNHWKVVENQTRTRERVDTADVPYSNQSNPSIRKRTLGINYNRTTKRRSVINSTVDAAATISEGHNNEDTCHYDTYHDDGYDFDIDDEDPTSFICPTDENQDSTLSQLESTSPQSAAGNTSLADGTERKEVFVGTENPHLSTSELLSLDLLKVIEDFNIPRSAYERLVKFVNWVITLRGGFDITNPCQEFITLLSPYLTENLLTSLYPVAKQEYDICSSGCHLFLDDDEASNCPNPKCQKARYRDAVQKKAYSTMQYLPLSDQLASLISNEATRKKYAAHRCNQWVLRKIKSKQVSMLTLY